MLKDKKVRRKRVLLITAGCILIAVIASVGSFLTYNEILAEKYGFLNTGGVIIPAPRETTVSEYDIELSEVTMHYAVYGEEGKKPLIFIHGNGSSHKAFENAAQYFAGEYTIYAIDSRCHGQSSDPGVITYDLMADDVYEFIEKLNIEKPYVYGHSDGAIVALTLACNYPDTPGAVIACGANSQPYMMKPYFTLAVLRANIRHKDKLNELMLTLPHLTAKKLERISCPTDIIIAENDIMWLSDAVFMHNNIKNSSLNILEGENHSSYIFTDTGKAYAVSAEFLDSLN